MRKRESGEKRLPVRREPTRKGTLTSLPLLNLTLPNSLSVYGWGVFEDETVHFNNPIHP